MLLIALPLGAVAALRPRSPVDRSLLAASVIGLAIHPFVLGIMLRDFFGKRLRVPDVGYCPLTTHPSGGCGGPRDWATHLAVPWLVFALFFLPLYMRMLRVRLLETFAEPWIVTARAKGATEPRILVGHALRNAIGPVLPMIAVDAGTAITAAIYVETVFGLSGLGLLAVKALSGQFGGYDLPLTAGIVTVIGAFVVVLNIAADVAAAWLDPRTRRRAASGLIPLPAALAARPRVRQALNVAVAAAVLALLALAATHRDKPHRPGIDIGAPVSTIRVSWDDSYRVETNFPPIRRGAVQTHVAEIQIGPDGWRVHATITNDTPLPLPIAQIPVARYPQQGMSLLVPMANGYGFRNLSVLSATAFVPALPKLLAPHSSWHGTFAGSDQIRNHAQIYVGFGQFNWNDRFLSIATARHATRS